MIPIVVVEALERWPFELEGVEVVSAREYLTERTYQELRGAAVYNLCRRYGYQTLGYYVSLLAEARGHRPLPSVATLQALHLSPVMRSVSNELDELIQNALRPLRSAHFDLSIYFGRNLTRRYDPLARALFNEFPAPMLRARFRRDPDPEAESGFGPWRVQTLRLVAGSDVPDSHVPFVLEQAGRFFRRRAPVVAREAKWSLAILWDPEDPSPPSDERAIRKFIRAASEQGIHAEILAPDETGRIVEYDALFLRETTGVNHRTYRLARRAEHEGLVVVDDPESIVRCSNKVFQAEAFQRHRIPAPRTLVVHRGNVDRIEGEVGFPCVLKRPDGAFSQGVVKVEDAAGLQRELPALFAQSELLVAQAWTPSTFDWRIGVLGGEPLFACRYHMAKGHWQIIRAPVDSTPGGETASPGTSGEAVPESDATGGERTYGRVETVPIEEAPELVVRTAVRATRLMGLGLYGVDLKEVEGRALVIEVNDNPNIESGYEDKVLGDELYLAVMRHFLHRLATL
jgi:glutathione synthase/RimK-type ligase-like ATP-grasp enzyme